MMNKYERPLGNVIVHGNQGLTRIPIHIDEKPRVPELVLGPWTLSLFEALVLRDALEEFACSMIHSERVRRRSDDEPVLAEAGRARDG